MKDKLPKKFSILGNDYTIHYGKDINCENTIGLCKSLECKIYIRTHFEGAELPKDQIMGTVWHEIFHAILTSLNMHDLNSNEDFVDTMGASVWQVLKTMK
jgi:hypothetical protein